MSDEEEEEEEEEEERKHGEDDGGEDEDEDEKVDYEDDDDNDDDDEKEAARGTPEEQLALGIDREQYAKLLRERRAAFRVFEGELKQVNFPLARKCTQGYHFRAARKWIGSPAHSAMWFAHIAHGLPAAAARQYTWETYGFWGKPKAPDAIWNASSAQVGTYTLVWLMLPHHSNVLVLNHAAKVAYIFEPHGEADDHTVFSVLPELNKHGFQLDAACVRKRVGGPQDKELRSHFHKFLHFLTNKGNCLLWSCLWMHLMLKCGTSPVQTAALLEAFSDDSTALLMMAYQTRGARTEASVAGGSQ